MDGWDDSGYILLAGLRRWKRKMRYQEVRDSTDLLSIIRTHMLLGFDELSAPYLPRQCSGIDMINETNTVALTNTMITLSISFSSCFDLLSLKLP
jgi:hypothetical protein